MSKQTTRTQSVSGAERAAAALDRAMWLNHKPARGGQMAIAMVDALIRSEMNAFTSSVFKRVSENVRTMR